MTSPDALPALVSKAIAHAAKRFQVKPPAWLRNASRQSGDTCCAFCGSPLDLNDPSAGELIALVPIHLGGALTTANRVLSCASCTRKKGNKDLPAWPGLNALASDERRKALNAQRLEVLKVSLNHLTPQRAMLPLQRLLDHLAQRWQHPRFQVYAIHLSPVSYIGWTSAAGAKEALGQAAGLLRFAAGATHQPGHDVNLFALPADQFLDAVWLLIEHHALVVPVSVEGLEAVAVDPAQFKGYWPLAWSNLSYLRRRKLRRSDPVVPRAPRVLVDNPYFRERIRKSKQEALKKQHDAARTALNAHYKAIAEGHFPALPFSIKLQLENDLAALCSRAYAKVGESEKWNHRPLVDPRDRLKGWLKDYVRDKSNQQETKKGSVTTRATLTGGRMS